MESSSQAFLFFLVAANFPMWHPIGVDPRALNLGRIAAVFALVVASGFLFLLELTPDQSSVYALPVVRQDESPRLIYSQNPGDSWNRIFFCLFTRRLQVRVSSEFPDGAPFMPLGANSNLQVSTRLFDRLVTGDRPVDPLYSPPPTTPEGSRQLLIEPRYSMFISAIGEALQEPAQRPALARALMQSDLWSAYDILYWPLFPQDRNTELDRHKQIASDLIAQLIRKIALKPEEIDSLPDNYSAARSHYSLPDLFGANSGWLEVQWFPDRMHDAQAEFRRTARVFVKPSQPPQDIQKFLNALRGHPPGSRARVEGAVILIQPLLIDSRGHLTPSRLVTDVEIRLFDKSTEGASQKTQIQVSELRRKLMLSDPESGGFVAEDENSPAFLSSGLPSDFASSAFAGTPSGAEPASPVAVKLRTRCLGCHGPDLTGLTTFLIAVPPHSTPPSVKQLEPTSHQAADYDISRKAKRAEWQALQAYFASGGRPAP